MEQVVVIEFETIGELLAFKNEAKLTIYLASFKDRLISFNSTEEILEISRYYNCRLLTDEAKTHSV